MAKKKNEKENIIKTVENTEVVENKDFVEETNNEKTDVITAKTEDIPVENIKEEENIETKNEQSAPEGVQANLRINTLVNEKITNEINKYNVTNFKPARHNTNKILKKPLKFNGYAWNGSFID